MKGLGEKVRHEVAFSLEIRNLRACLEIACRPLKDPPKEVLYRCGVSVYDRFYKGKEFS
jgi:hypothetical protein